MGGDALQTDQLKHGARKDIHARTKNVGPQKFVPVGAVGGSQLIKKVYQLLQHQLKFSGHQRKPRDHQHPHQRRKDQQQRRYCKARDQRRVHCFQPKQADLVVAVQHGIPHGTLHTFAFRRWPDRQRRRQHRNERQHPNGYKHRAFSFAHVRFSFLIMLCAQNFLSTFEHLFIIMLLSLYG